MIEEIVLAMVGLVLVRRDKKCCWEEVIGVSLGSVFVLVVLLTVGLFVPGQGENLSVFMRLMLFGYLPMRVFAWIRGTGLSSE